MPLDKTQLQAALKTAFDTAKDQNWTTDQVAQAIADAVDTFVRGGDVNGITVTVRDNANVQIGTGSQTTAVQLQ